MTWNLRFFGCLAACGLLVVAGGCRKQQAAPPRPPPAVETAPAVQMDAPVVIRAFGSTVDRQSVDIVPQVSGVLVQTLVADGAVVTNGQPLFQIDPRDYAVRVRQVEGMMAADRANLELSRTTLDRNRALLDKQLIAQGDFDTLKTRVDATAAQLAIDEATLDQARLNLARCTIAAPWPGICSKRYLNDGNLVTAGLTKLINIRSYDPMDLEFSVPEEYVPLIRRAMAEGPVAIEITPQESTNLCTGTLTFLDNTVSTDTGTILLRGQAPNADLKLWAGQFVEISVLAGAISKAVMVPEGAIQYGKQGTYLFVVSQANKAEMRPVKTGVRYRGLIQIVDGVAPGERVVVLGQLMLFPGAPVNDTAQQPQGTNAAPGMAAAGGAGGGK